MAIEVELKLLFDARAARSILRWPGWQSRKRGRARRHALLTTYFDTPDFALERVGAALRLRQAGHQWMQTLKFGGSASGGVHARVEHEWIVAGPALESRHLEELELDRPLARIDWSAVRPVFTTRFERTVFAIALAEDCSAEVAIDLGQVVAGARNAPIAEIEVELTTAGDALENAAEERHVVHLFDLASELVAALPLRLGAQSKAERGYALARRYPMRPSRAADLELDGKGSTLDAARAAMHACLTQIQANDVGFLRQSDPEYLHQLRVGLRRLRAALGCFRDLIPAAEQEALKTELRWLGSALGPARDWDVWCISTLPRVVEWFARSQGDNRRDVDLQSLERITARATTLRRRARRMARAAVASPRYTQLLLRCARLFATTNPNTREAADPLRERAPRLLLRRHDSLIAKTALASTTHALHTMRIAAKKLRYCAEFFRKLGGAKRARRYIGALARLQDVLGAGNDAVVAQRLLDAVLTDATLRRDDVIHEPTAAMLRGWLGGVESVHCEAVSLALEAWRKRDPFW